MPQHLTNCGHRRAGTQQIAGQRVSQLMRRDTLGPGAPACVAHDRAHPRGLKRPDWRVCGQEHAGLAGTAAATAQVSDQRVCDLGRERKPSALMTLAVDADLAGRLVQIAELKAGDLDGPESQSGEQEQHGPVSRRCNAATLT